jgi:hypothetical protein
VSALGNQSFVTESAVVDSSRSKSVIGLPTEDSVQKLILNAKAIEQSGEIEDIIKAAKKEVEIPKKEEAKKAEAPKPVPDVKLPAKDDDYDEDFE